VALNLEDYAFVGDAHGAALIGRDGSVDWLCVPRFDSGACFAALLGDANAGRWLLAPTDAPLSSSWRYRGDSLVLETDWHTRGGTVRVVDCMPPKGEASDLVRVVEGVAGSVELRFELRVRFDQGRVQPWFRRLPDGRVVYVAGPDALYLSGDIDLDPDPDGGDTTATFTVRQGQRVRFVLTSHPSWQPPPHPVDADGALREAADWWESWMAPCSYRGEYGEAVRRSLVVLKGLTYTPTGGIVAAPTTSLPEQLGGVRNWDYRFSWLRDATITLLALLESGFSAEAAAWRRWLVRALAGDPSQLQIMYGVAGERHLTERELPWLPGYQGARPVRSGNAAEGQLQLDVYGEVMDALHQSRLAGLHRGGRGTWPDLDATGAAGAVGDDDASWPLQRALLEVLESKWECPDSGMWEMRGEPRQNTYSKVMAWVAVDRALRGAEQFGLAAPVDRWRALRQKIFDDVCANGFDERRATFTQSYGSPHLDASLLNMPLVGFLPVDDPRVAGTIRAVERELSSDGFVWRYDTAVEHDGLPPGEGAFLACTLWLAECQAQQGRRREAVDTFERVLAVRTDLGLLSEEYDPAAGRLVGNFPQAFSHVPLVRTAAALSGSSTPRRG